MLDPVAYLFSAYLNSVQTTTYDHLTDSIGTEIKAVVIEYEGVNIPFQFQMWRIRSSSVCGNLSQNMAAYSQCTIKASKLFSELCSGLKAKRGKDWRYKKTKNMYCNAAVSYKPTIAHISAAIEESDIQRTKKECNSATIEAMDSGDPGVVKKRDASCKRYRELKQQP